MPRYECDMCGACCKGYLIVEAYELDVMREPRLATNHISADKAYDILDVDPAAVVDVMAHFDAELGRCLVLACGTDHPCRFLNEENRCAIYPTRPNACVSMEAGDDQCQASRQEAGLPPLEPINDDPSPSK